MKFVKEQKEATELSSLNEKNNNWRLLPKRKIEIQNLSKKAMRRFQED